MLNYSNYAKNFKIFSQKISRKQICLDISIKSFQQILLHLIGFLGEKRQWENKSGRTDKFVHSSWRNIKIRAVLLDTSHLIWIFIIQAARDSRSIFLYFYLVSRVRHSYTQKPRRIVSLPLDIAPLYVQIGDLSALEC